MESIPIATIYTDGACIKNPGRGGIGVIVRRGGESIELAQGFAYTTSNRLKILAAIRGLEVLQTRSRVAVYSASLYLVNSILEGNAYRWQRGGWLRNGQKVPNADLWELLLGLCAAHDITFEWVKDDSGIEEMGRCAELVNRSGHDPDPLLDDGYETFLRENAAGKNLIDVFGDTFRQRAALKSFGLRWDGEKKIWSAEVPEEISVKIKRFCKKKGLGYSHHSDPLEELDPVAKPKNWAQRKPLSRTTKRRNKGGRNNRIKRSTT